MEANQRRTLHADICFKIIVNIVARPQREIC